MAIRTAARATMNAITANVIDVRNVNFRRVLMVDPFFGPATRAGRVPLRGHAAQFKLSLIQRKPRFATNRFYLVIAHQLAIPLAPYFRGGRGASFVTGKELQF